MTPRSVASVHGNDGAGRKLTYRHGVPIGTDWTPIVVPLSQAGSGDRCQEANQPVDEATLAAVLGDVTRLRIRGEYRTGPDTGGLGFVYLGYRTN